MEQPKTNQITAQTKWYVVTGVAISVIVTLYFLSSVFKGSSGTSKYEAKVLATSVTSASIVAVELKVTNNGTKSGTPLCTIEVGNQTSGPSGNDEFLMKNSLAPGQGVISTQQVSISEQGAAKVGSATVSCS